MGMRDLWPWILPFAVFMAFLVVEGWFPDQHYPLAALCAFSVFAVILWNRKAYPSLRPGFPLLSTLVGLVSVVLWIGLDPLLVHYPPPLIGRNPFILYPATLAWTLFALRMFGFAITTPIMEELFWRGFLMRWLIVEELLWRRQKIKDDFTQIPLGTYRPFSFFATTALFAAVHGSEWPLAVIVGLLFGALFLYTKKLGDIMLAHGVTNLLLGLYCLDTGDWHFLSIIAPPK